MQGIAKAVLISILVSVCLLLFTNLIYFFPWYMTLVVETHNLSQTATVDNYVKQSYYDDILDRMQNRPIYRQKASKIEIIATNASGYSAIGRDDEDYYFGFLSELEKPYRQRGEPIDVEIRAVYPFTITLWGEQLERELPVSYALSTVGLKHYKDLPYE